MSNNIIPNDSNIPLDCHSSDCQHRAERTPGAVAVSQVRQEAGCQTDSLPQPAKTNSGGVCGAYAIVSECSSHHHHFAKKIVCGKEWCSDCGTNRSKAHNRRIARILPKALQIASLGYFVIEFPDKYRKVVTYAYSKRALQYASKAIIDTLAGKRCGRKGRVGGYYSRGLLRWHWFGDEVEGKYNPHANVLVDGGYIEPEQLEVIKLALRKALHCQDLIVNYSFVDTPGKMFHKVAYVTRATFLNYEWDAYMANQLGSSWDTKLDKRIAGFRNQRWWGSWQGEAVWSVEQAEAEGEDAEGLLQVSNLQSGVCPDCGQPLEPIGVNKHTGQPVYWTKPIDSAWLVAWDAKEIAHSGYYRIPHKVWNGGELSPGVLLRLEQLERSARDKPSVDIKRIRAKRLLAIRQARLEDNASLDDYIDGM